MDKASRKERDPAVLESLSRLLEIPSFQRLQEEVREARELYMANFARGLASSKRPVDQREVDEKRGFWAGALWAVTTVPTIASKDYKNLIEAAEAAIKEAE